MLFVYALLLETYSVATAPTTVKIDRGRLFVSLALSSITANRITEY